MAMLQVDCFVAKVFFLQARLKKMTIWSDFKVHNIEQNSVRKKKKKSLQVFRNSS